MKSTFLSIVLVSFSLLIAPVQAKKKEWNQDLSNMMDGLEKEVESAPPGPDKNPPSKNPPPGMLKENPVPELPDQPLPKDPSIKVIQKKAAPVKPKIDTKHLLDNLMKMKDNYLGSIAPHGLTRWPQSTMPLKVFIESSSKAKDFRDEYPSLLKEAFNAWTETKKIQISFTDNLDEAHIVCRWTDDKNDLMSILEGGNTVIVPDDNGILSVDMKILTLPPPGASSVSTNYMGRVCLHEAGHALGLTGHSPMREDVMYPTVYPNEPAKLTERDLNSMTELYNMDKQAILSMRLDQARAMKEIPKEFDNPQVNAVRLNNDAARALKSNKFDIAKVKLEQAHKLDPKNKLVCANLGGIYANYGSIAAMAFNLPTAYSYYKKCVPLLEKGNNKKALVQILPNYLRILKLMKKESEYKRMNQKLLSLQHR